MADFLFAAEIFDKFVKVKNGKSERNISHMDFLETFAGKLGIWSKLAHKDEEFAGSFVTTYPESFLYEVTLSPTKKVLYLYHKEANLPISLDLREGYQLKHIRGIDTEKLIEALAKGNVHHDNNMLIYKTMRMPNIVCKINLDKKGVKKDGQDKWTVGTVKYSFTDLPRAMAKVLKKDASLNEVITTLGWLPFPNTYQDGHICYGSNQTIINIESERFKDLEQYMHFITAIPYNFHVAGDRNIGNPAGKVPKEASIDAFLEQNGVPGFKKAYVSAFRESSYDIVNWFFYLNQQTAFPYNWFK